MSTTGVVRSTKIILAQLGFTSIRDLKKLESLGVIIYRTHSEEYRIWEGTDININFLINIKREQNSKLTLIDTLQKISKPLPVVASRHSAQFDTLRIFARRYWDGREKSFLLILFPLTTVSYCYSCQITRESQRITRCQQTQNLLLQ